MTYGLNVGYNFFENFKLCENKFSFYLFHVALSVDGERPGTAAADDGGRGGSVVELPLGRGPVQEVARGGGSGTGSRRGVLLKLRSGGLFIFWRRPNRIADLVEFLNKPPKG